jgi:PAS domain-containing protein
MEVTPARPALKIPRATWLVVSVAVVGGALTLLCAAWRQAAWAHVDGSQWLIAAGMGMLALGSWTWPVVVYRGAESEAVNMDEAFFVILALLVSPPLVLGSLALATLLAQAARRRPLVKSAFNVGQVLITAGLGLAASRSLTSPTRSLMLGQIAAVVLGVGVYFATNLLLVCLVEVSLGTTRKEFTNDLPLQVTLAGAGTLAGVILALAVHAHLWALVLAVPGLVLLRRLISARFAALHDRGRMKGLYEVTLEANRGLREQAVLETILGAVRRLLRSPGVALTSGDPGPGQLAAPMTVAGRRQWLMASGRRRDEPFDDADRGLLQALAAVGSGALSNAELYQQVRVERERLSSITLNMGEGVCAIDASGRLTFVNPAAAAMIELPSLDITIDDPVSDGAPMAPGFLLVPAREAMRTGRTVRVDDARFRGKDGETIPVA